MSHLLAPRSRACVPQASPDGYRCAICNAGPYKSASFKRACKDKTPGVLARVASYVLAQVEHLIAGKEVSREIIESRVAICEPCPMFTGAACSLCGCACNGEPNHWVNKLALSNPEWPTSEEFICPQIAAENAKGAAA